MAGIMPSEAATIVDNGTMAVKRFTQAEMNSISPSIKFKQFCELEELETIKDFIRTDKAAGLPSIGYEINNEFIKTVNLGSEYGNLIDRVSQHAEPMNVPL